jgi:hypothetical protein
MLSFAAHTQRLGSYRPQILTPFLTHTLILTASPDPPSYEDIYAQTMLYIIFHLCVYIYLPVHIMSISGASLDPSVLRYSEFWTLGVARAAQYCVGHNIKRGWLRC